MKNSQILVLIFFGLNIPVGCDSHPTENRSIPEITQKNETDEKDSIVAYYAAQIKEYYSELQKNQNKIELDLVGKRAFENDTIFIVSFSEIIKFGSYRYSNSSLVFKKENNQLIPLEPFPLADEIVLPLDEEINYPNRIPGEFDKSIDLTGDGIPEYIFLQHNAFKNNSEEKKRIYSIDFKQNELNQIN